MIANDSANPSKKHLMELADYFKVKNAKAIIDQVQSIVFNWKMYADQCEVSKVSKNKIDKLISKKL